MQPPFLVVNVLDTDIVVGVNWVAVCWVVESRGRHLPKSVRIIYRTWSSCLAVERFARPCAPPASHFDILVISLFVCVCWLERRRKYPSCISSGSVLLGRSSGKILSLNAYQCLCSWALCAWFQPACMPLKLHGLSMFASITPTSLCRILAFTALIPIQIGLCIPMFWSPISTTCISTSNMVRSDASPHNCTVEERLMVGFCGQLQ